MKPWPVQGFLLDILRHFKNMEEQFKIRSYGYGELAQLYFPNITKKSASWQLTKWINDNRIIKLKLLKSGRKRGQKILSPNQVQIIIAEFGTP